jgi:hypothetical protein
VCTVAAKSFDDLEIVLPRPKRPRRQFFSRFVKERFRILDIQITIFYKIKEIENPKKKISYSRKLKKSSVTCRKC